MAKRLYRHVALALAVLVCWGAAPGSHAMIGGRRLLGSNPDLPSQRGDTPSWMSPGSSSPQSQASQGQSQGGQADLSAMVSDLASSSQPSASSPALVFAGGKFGSGWHDSSYNARPFTSFAPAGKDFGTASCHYLPVGAAKSFWGPQGSFSGMRALQFWAYAGDVGVADVDIVLYGRSSSSCRHVPLSSLLVVESASGWVKYWIDLGAFSWALQSGGGAFPGCDSSGTSAGELVKVDFFNPHPEYEALLCIDELQLMS